MSSLASYLRTEDPFAQGLVLRPEDLPEEIAGVVRKEKDFRDGIDSAEELRRLMQMLEQTGGEANGLARPSFQNLNGMSAQDMLQMLVDWINSGGPEANKKITRPRPIGTLSSPSGGYQSQPTSWQGGGGSSGGGSTGGTTSSGGATGGTTAGSGAQHPTGDVAPLKRSDIDTSKVDTSKIEDYANLSPKAQEAAKIAVAMGLTVTSTTGDTHSASSHHYARNNADGKGHAIDVGGSPELMARFYNTMKSLDPKPIELFYDPLGGIKNGQQIGAIGGHGDHVHYTG